MATNGKNGQDDHPLSALGAPHWFVASERANEARHAGICQRVEALESAVGVGATAHGAKAGRKWGAILGALVATFASTALSHCSNPTDPPSGTHSQ